jgi:sugar lactone lactonase YvrE
MKGWAVVALAIWAGAAQAQTIDPNSDLGRFRAAREEGTKALDASDPTGAMKAFNTAGDILPDSPSILLLKAQVAMKQHKVPTAQAVLKDYLKRGYVLDLNKNPDFNAVWASDLEEMDQANIVPTGEMQILSTSDDFAVTEGFTYAPDTNQVFVSGVRTGTVTVLSPQGARDLITFRPGVAAYGLGLRDGKLWATTAATRQTASFDAKAKPVTSKIVVIDPANGQVVKSFSDTKQTRRFGHMLLGKDDLYVTDAEHGEVMRLAGYTGDLQVLVPEGYMDTPDALAENEAATSLVVADFVSGLYRVDLATGQMSRLMPPADGSLLGISFLARYGNDLIAVQTGFKPNRILRLHLSDDWTQVTSSEVLLRSPKDLSQPTQGVVTGDRFVFVAKSQWANLDDHGQPIKPQADPAVIGSINLKP